MSSRRNQIIYALVGMAWAATVALGLTRLWSYESTSSLPAQPPLSWPADTNLIRTSGLPTLVLLAHPRCPCSRATIGELAKLMTTCQGRMTAIVLVLRPERMPSGWEHTDLWDDAIAIPGVSVVADPGGVQSRRFGAITSGQTLLFSTDGRLLFSGGITESRGHSGDNDGRSAVASLVFKQRTGQPIHTPVYGCPLFDESSPCQKEGISTCQVK